ncbi:MAG TPA: hypothetical protein VKA76_07975 [Gammaproteobacteria bacterium]|nr:hypothetical protein [Gammaproteobacteria bacterium]
MDMVDIAFQFNDTLDEGRQQQIEASLRELEGVISVHLHHGAHPAMLVQINPERVRSEGVLSQLQAQGLNARMIVPDRLSAIGAH